MRLTIFSRLVFGYLAILSLVMAMSAYALFQIGQSNKVIHSALVIDSRLITFAGKLTDILLSQIRFERKFIITKDNVLYDLFLRNKSDFGQYFKEMMSLADDSQTQIFLSRANEHYQRYQTLFEEEVKYLKAGINYPQQWYKKEKEKATDGFMEELERLGSYSQQNTYSKIKGLHEAGAVAQRVVLVMTAAFLALGIVISIFINRSITQPISIIKKKTREIAKGNFEGDLRLSSPPEIEELAGALNFMCNKLKDLDKMKSDFFASMSHELRTPLTSIKEGISLLQDGVGGTITDKQKRLLMILTMESNRLINLVNSLLDLSKMEAGMMTYAFKLTPVASLIEKAMMEIGLLAEAKKIILETKIDRGLPILRIDSERILQVLRNLIGNAVKFTPEGGRVRVSARPVDQSLEVSVADTGPGISKENLINIFEKFHQAPLRNTDQIKGTGLGLAIVKHVITAHGGRVWAESEPGQGSTFIFVLPF